MFDFDDVALSSMFSFQAKREKHGRCPKVFGKNTEDNHKTRSRGRAARGFLVFDQMDEDVDVTGQN